GPVRAVDKRLLEQVVDLLEAVAHAEGHAKLLEAPRRQGTAIRQLHLPARQMRADRRRALPVLGIAGKVQPILAQHSLVRGAVDMVGAVSDRRWPASDECLTQPLRGQGEIGGDAEAAVALAKNAPTLARSKQLATNALGIMHDGVGAEVLEVIGLRLRVTAPGQCAGSDR